MTKEKDILNKGTISSFAFVVIDKMKKVIQGIFDQQIHNQRSQPHQSTTVQEETDKRKRPIPAKMQLNYHSIQVTHAKELKVIPQADSMNFEMKINY
jgi:selenophosphate synthase